MKSRFTSVTRLFLALVFLCAASIETAAARRARPAGRLIVLRPANFGSNLAFNLAIDGRPVGNIVRGRKYQTWLPPGRHVSTVFKVPRTGIAGPTSTTVGKPPVKRSMNDVSEVKVNFMGFRCIGESIERHLQLDFEVFQSA